MKTKLGLFMLVGMLFIMACQNRKSKAVQRFIDGIYVNHAQGEYGIADDTITFTHEDEKLYIITRNTGYQAVRNGQLMSRRFKRQKFEGTYDPQNRVLNEMTTGRLFRFDPDKGLMLLKQAVYRKVN